MSREIKLPKLEFDKYLFRIVFTVLLLAFILSQVPWSEIVIARIWNFPELRHQVVWRSTEGEQPNQASFIVANTGFKSADNVLIHICIREPSIISYWIDSQELYELKTENLKEGILNIWLDRLGSGASIEILITTAQALSDENIKFSAVSDQGSSAPIQSQTSSEQIDIYARSTTKTFSEQLHIYARSTTNLFIQAAAIISEAKPVQKVISWISTRSSLHEIWQTASTKEFKTVSLAVLIIVGAVGVLFRYQYFLLAVTCGVWLIVWLFFDIVIPVNGFIAVLVIIGLVIWGHESKIDWRLGIALGVLVLATWGFSIWWFWYAKMSLNWLIAIIVATVVTNLVRSSGILRSDSTIGQK